VLDANILIRAVLGNRVRRILEKNADSVSFFIPEYAYAEAEEHLAAFVTKRGGDPAKGLIMLRAVAALADLATTDGICTCSWLSDLDRGYRLLRTWRY